MKHLYITAAIIASLSTASCTRQSKNVPVTKDPVSTAARSVDSVSGTYHGYMHVHSWSASYLDLDHPHEFDTTYPFTVVISPLTADSIIVDTLFSNWIYHPSITSTNHIKYTAANIYTIYCPWGEADTLILVPGADSLYFHSSYYKPGGATTQSELRTFTATK